MGNPIDQQLVDPAQAGEEQPNVTPEEQAAYDQFVNNGMQLMYQGEQVAPAILNHLQGKWDDIAPMLGELPQDEGNLDPSNPIDGLAVATVGIVLALEASAAEAGKELDPAVVFHGGAEIAEQLVEVAETAGIHEFSPEDMEGGANRAALLYGVSSKSVNREEALSEFDHFLQTQGENLGAAFGGQQGQPQPMEG